MAAESTIEFFYARKRASRPTASLRYFCHPLSPDAVDGYEHALSGLHRVENRTLHSSVAGATHGNGHVVLCLKSVPDPFFDIIHYLRNTHTKKLETRVPNFIGCKCISNTYNHHHLLKYNFTESNLCEIIN